jgi:predicted signal transduction protein with EAL and GGDEF domain
VNLLTHATGAQIAVSLLVAWIWAPVGWIEQEAFAGLAPRSGSVEEGLRVASPPRLWSRAPCS